MDNVRYMAIMQNLQSFCKKYQLSYDYDDPRVILKSGLTHMAVANKIDSMTEDGKKRQYIGVVVNFMGEFMTRGVFTPEQIKDIADIDSNEISFD